MTTKKKHLIELMIEAGVKWPEGAEYAAQDADDLNVYFYVLKPRRHAGRPNWHGGGANAADAKQLHEICRNWHQAIVTKAQYEAAVAEQPEQPAATESQQRGFSTPATIEQRIAELRAMEKQVAELRAKLTNDLHTMGINWLDGDICDAKSVQPAITDWRDLRVGDVIEFEGVDGEWDILNLEDEYDEAPIKVSDDIRAECDVEGWVNILSHPWRFIRRPQH